MDYSNKKMKKFNDEELTDIVGGMHQGHFGEYYFEPDELKEGYEVSKPLRNGAYKEACLVSKKLSNGKYRDADVKEITEVLKAYGKAKDVIML